MKLPRRQFLHLAAGAAVLPALSGTALALDYPTRPVTLSGYSIVSVLRLPAAHVRFGSEADLTPLNFDVRFTPESGHR
jgi:hypothetical protein